MYSEFSLPKNYVNSIYWKIRNFLLMVRVILIYIYNFLLNYHHWMNSSFLFLQRIYAIARPEVDWEAIKNKHNFSNNDSSNAA